MSVDLDIKDKKILLELDRNARQTNSKIAKKTRLSKDAVGYRIKQLETKKIILGYRTLINTSKLGYTQYRILFQLVNINKTILENLINDLRQENMVWLIGQNEGEWDIAFTFLTKSSIDFYEFIETLMKKYRQIIKTSHISQIIKYEDTERSYLTNQKKPIQKKPIFSKETIKIDEIDKKILQTLAENARTKLIDIAKKLKLSSMLILQRIKKLEKNQIIEGYKIDLNVLKLERDYYGIKMTLDNYSEKEQILNDIYQIKEQTAILHTLGGYDIEFDLEVKNTKQYYEIINKLREKFSSIREIKYMRSIDYYKLTHFPK